MGCLIRNIFTSELLTQKYINDIICTYISKEDGRIFMDGSLTQEELDALLANIDIDQDNGEEENLTTEDVDAIGEIANICAGSSATNLSTVLNQRVNISTPEVVVTSKEELLNGINQP